MPLSGSNTGALRPYTALQLLEEACSRAGIPPARLTPEIIEKSLDQMNLLFTSLTNRGIQLWKRQKLILPCYLNTAQCPLPVGNNIVVNLNRRSLSRQSGTPFTTAGGTAALAFDDDFDTACTQTSANGSIGCLFTASTLTQITTVGVLFAAAGSFAVFYEYTQDNVTWTALDATNVVATPGMWHWYDLDGAPQALGWRIRSASTQILSVSELFFGNTPSEIVLGPWNLDDYTSMPNKSQGGQIVNWYQQRDISNPVLYVWPVPNDLAKYDTLVLWAHQLLDTVSQITQSLDVPPRWNEAVTAMLARRLCRSLEEADMKRYPMLATEEVEAVMVATAEERDPAPTNFDLNISVYTR